MKSKSSDAMLRSVGECIGVDLHEGRKFVLAHPHGNPIVGRFRRNLGTRMLMNMIWMHADLCPSRFRKFTT